MDPHPLPPKAVPSKLLQQAITQISSIAASSTFATNSCARCQSILEIAKFLSLAAPDQGPDLVVGLCKLFKLSSTCDDSYGRLALGPVLTQVLANADIGGLDGQVSQLFVVVDLFVTFVSERCCVKTLSAYAPYLRLHL